jgi:hypothetical protein
MSEYTIHKGIGFAVREIGSGRWQWTVSPPESVRGLEKASGEISGGRSDAIAAAKCEIDTQDLRVA